MVAQPTMLLCTLWHNCRGSAAAASRAGVRSSSTRLRDQSSGPMCRSCRTAPARDRLIEIVNGSASGSVSLTALAFVAMQ
jgi:hypothetical protein